MLFVYGSEGRLQFWMRNTLIPLDIAFLSTAFQVVDVQLMVPEPDVPPKELTIYTSAAPAHYALEINAGRAEACDVVPGVQATVTGLDAD